MHRKAQVPVDLGVRARGDHRSQRQRFCFNRKAIEKLSGRRVHPVDVLDNQAGRPSAAVESVTSRPAHLTSTAADVRLE